RSPPRRDRDHPREAARRGRSQGAVRSGRRSADTAGRAATPWVTPAALLPPCGHTAAGAVVPFDLTSLSAEQNCPEGQDGFSVGIMTTGRGLRWVVMMHRRKPAEAVGAGAAGAPGHVLTRCNLGAVSAGSAAPHVAGPSTRSMTATTS